MTQCPYCLYQNSIGSTICGNCKNDLPSDTPSRTILSSDTPSRKLLSYAPQPTGVSAPQLDFASGPISQPALPQTDRIYPSPSEQMYRQPVSQSSYVFASPPEQIYYPPVYSPFTPSPDLAQRALLEDAYYFPASHQTYTTTPDYPKTSNMYATAPEPAYPPHLYQIDQAHETPSEPTQPPAAPQTSQLPIVSSHLLFSSRRAFAGHGIFLRHRSFVLPRASAQLNQVQQTIEELLRQRNPNVQLSGKDLREHGFYPEERHYLMLRQRASSIFVYIAPAGDDLYISRSTSVLCPINLGRIFALLLMITAICIPFLLLPNVMASAAHNMATISNAALTPSIYGASANTSAPVTLGMAILLGILTILCATMNAIMLAWYLVCSIIHWLREKDLFIYLRSLYLKDFEMDDITLLEHITDTTIRAAVDKIGFDASLITPPEGGYKQERRVCLL